MITSSINGPITYTTGDTFIINGVSYGIIDNPISQNKELINLLSCIVKHVFSNTDIITMEVLENIFPNATIQYVKLKISLL